tara:strand:+ start:316 stop:525 length:210 start_codon:yes stop_codon:yes gene_type:complete
MENKKLSVGEKYLSIEIEFGGQKLKFVAFPNKEATEENRQPNFRVKGGGAVWVNTKKEEQTPVSTEAVL